MHPFGFPVLNPAFLGGVQVNFGDEVEVYSLIIVDQGGASNNIYVHTRIVLILM